MEIKIDMRRHSRSTIHDRVLHPSSLQRIISRPLTPKTDQKQGRAKETEALRRLFPTPTPTPWLQIGIESGISNLA